jgi:hypothetical protein
MLNYIIAFGLLSIVYWDYIVRITGWLHKSSIRMVNFFIADYSRTIGNIGLITTFLTFWYRNEQTYIGLGLATISVVLLSVGWNFAAFRKIDSFANFIVYFINRLFSIITTITKALYHNITISRTISSISWILFFIAIFNLLSIDRILLFGAWFILWHLAYRHRIIRWKKWGHAILIGTYNFTKNVVISTGRFIHNIIQILTTFIKQAFITIYSHIIVIIFWVIAIFFAILGAALVLPISFQFTRSIFGEVAEDTLITIIIGFTLLSAAVISFQQTYIRREKLLIGGTSK